MIYLEAFSKVLPVILLFILGASLRRTRFLAESTVGDLKKLIVNITLPAVLFLAFAGVNLEGRHLAIVAVVFAACLLALLLGRLIGPPLGLRSPYFPALMTGFEAGMMGYAIFGAVYGAGQIFNFAVVDLGQVLFVFFILVPFVQRISTGAISFGQTLRTFLKTPVIIAIFLGIIANRLGVLPRAAGVAGLGGCGADGRAARRADHAAHRPGDRLRGAPAARQSVEAGGGHRTAAAGVGARRIVAQRARGSTVVRRRAGASGRGDDHVCPAPAVRHPAVHA